MFVLDSKVVSELRKAKAGKADLNVTAWACAVSADVLYVSAITVLELETGVLLVHRRYPRQGALLRLWPDQHVLPAFLARVLPVDTAVAQCCAALHVPDPVSERGALIAATAMVHNMIVVTRNVANFAATGVPLINPWDPVAGPGERRAR